jgi:uncharacterized protein (DUF362 family)
VVVEMTSESSRQQRREFLRQIGGTTLALAASAGAAWWLHGREPSSDDGSLPPLPSFRVPVSAADVQLAMAHGTSAEVMVRAAVGELGGIRRFIRAGDVVLIKPNVAFDRAPILGATTSPDVVGAIVRLCREAGAGKVVVADNPINSAEGAFQKTGIRKAAEDAGAVVLYPRARDFRPLAIEGNVLRRWPVFHRAFEGVTRVIGVAPVKDHNLCGASLTMKNWYGLLGGGRNQLHQKIHEVIADLASMVQPTLVLLDGTRVLMSNGPTGGSPADVVAGNTIVAGVDQVAVDAYGVTLLGRDPAAVAYLRIAHDRGLGRQDWQALPRRELTV